MRMLVLACLVAVALATASKIARTSRLIAEAEPRNVAVHADWLDMGVMSSEHDGIHYQPVLCAIMGDEVSRFVKWHEYGHMLLDRGFRTQSEREDAADACAARYAPRDATLETIAWLRNRNDAGDEYHRPSAERATLIEKSL